MNKEEKNNLDIEVYEFNFPIMKSDIIPPEGFEFTDNMFTEIMDRYNTTINGKIILDSYYTDETLSEKMMDASHAIKGIMKKDGQYYLQIGILRQSESGRMLRKFILDGEMRILVGALWNIIDDKATVDAVRFNFIKTTNKRREQ